jgi:ABC-type branched-subunit amino acid transport system ATPase component/branched-subunit amino acid ABC-type transport system permease component
MMDKLLTLVVSGAVTGAIYSLVATGLALSYSATGIFNFSYGGIAFSSAYLFYVLNTGLAWPNWAAGIVIVAVVAPLLGLALDAAVFRPLARASESAKIVATVGLLLAIPALTEWLTDGVVNIFHVDIPRSSDVLQAGFPPGLGPVPEKSWHLPGGIPINSDELVVFASAAVCAAVLWLLLRHTALGLQMRAVVDRADLARIRGINDASTSRYAWVIGTVLAALAGVVAAPILGSISTSAYLTVTFVASAAVVLGRFRSIPLVFLGGLFLGVAQDLVAGYASFASSISGFNASVPTVILLGGLVLLGHDRSRRAGSAADDSPPSDVLAHLPWQRRALPWTLATIFVVIYVLFLANAFWAGVMAQGLALSIIFLSYVVVTGMGGMVSLAQATFVTAAGLTTGLLFQQYHLPFFAAAAIAILITALVGALVALPALRLGGLPLALATLALAILGDNLLFQWNWLSNQASGWTIPRIKVGPLDLANNRTMALTLLVIVGVLMVLINNLKRSSWGRSIAAVRSSEVAAATSGISPVRVKLALFSVSAVIAAVGGILYASFQTNISNTTTPYVDGLLWLATVVLFGIRRPAAAALAGVASAAFTVLIQSGFHWWSWVPSWLSWNGTQSSEIPLVLFGLGAVTLARSPDGFLAQAAVRRYERRSRRRMGDSSFGARVVPARPSGTAGGQADEAERPEGASPRGAGSTKRALPLELSAALQISDLYVSYGDVEVLHGVSLSVTAGQTTCLLGANGGGKSTLCATVSGLVIASSGVISVDGEDITRLPPHRRVDRGIMVAPESRGVFPGLTVEENLALRLGAGHREAAFDRFPRLAERRRLAAGSLSGGEQQMLALAPVLVDPPRVVVVDEPTLGLAPLVVEQVLGIFVELCERGTAVLLIEEKARDVLTIADSVAFLELGRVVWNGARGDLDDDRLVGAYFGAAL